MKKTMFLMSMLFLSALLFPQNGFTQLSLPEGAKLRIGKGYETGSSIFSKDGTRFAIASNVGLWVYDVFSHQTVALLSRHSNYFPVIVSSPDGSMLASANNNEIMLWEMPSGHRAGTFTDHNQNVRALAFSPNGEILASGSEDNTIRLWNTTNGRLLSLPLKAHTGAVISLAFSPDGKVLASGSTDRTIRLWSATTGEHLATLERKVVWGTVTDSGHTGSVTALAFSPDGETLASGATDFTIRLWNVRTHQHLTALGGHGGGVFALAFSPNGKILASGSSDTTVRLWNPDTGRHLDTLESHRTRVTSVAFSEDGNILASGDVDNWVCRWDGNTGQYLWKVLLGREIYKPSYLYWANSRLEPTPLSTYRGVQAVAFSPDGAILASGHRRTTYLTNVITDATLKRTNILTERKGHTYLHNTFDGRHLSTPTDDFLVSSVVFSPNGKILVSGGEYADTPISFATLCSVFGGNCYRRYSKERVSRNYPLAWRNFDTNRTAILEGHKDRISAVVFSPNGKVIASGSWDKTIRLWDSITGRPLTTYHGHKDDINTVAFSPDGGTLASGSDDNTIILWNPDGSARRVLHGHDAPVNSIVFSPNGKVLASGSSDKTIRLWNPNTGEHIDTLDEHTYSILSVAFSPDGGTLASGSADNTIRLWNPTTGEHLKTFTGHIAAVNAVAFSPDGTTLASGSNDSTILLWEIVPAMSEDLLDVNGDGVINILDLTAVAANFGKTGQNPADVNGDGVVNINDIVLVAGAMGDAPAAPSISPQILQTLTAADIEKWLIDAKELKFTDTTKQKGIAALEQLLEVLRQAEVKPTQTALLHNYPNPFNPETWIPYQLAKPSDVSISIYAADGTVVRTLMLGHQPVGIYQDKSRAAYWDGKNALGEPAASGVYFYTLTAREFTATRKMLIRK